ncbi:MAG TPA: MFS transporter, partial [Ramlibacter sp.]|nr:MFS transporter [Ramlibacter sp.]
NESPAFKKMKEEGKVSKAPLTESFGQWKNAKIVMLALFGLVMGQGVVWYSGQFYALFFLANVLKVDSATANIMVAVSLIIGTPFFVVFGTLSDKIGRKPIILAGMALAVLTYFPLFKALTAAANPELAKAQAVVWYSGQFYALFFLTQALKVDGATANILVAASLLIGTPFFIVFGSLSDKIGRKPIIMAGCLLAALTYFPVFGALTKAANPDLAAAQAKNKVVVTADPNECSFQFNPTGTAKFTSSCDIAKQVLAGASVSYENAAAPAGTVASIKVGETVINGYSSKGLPADEAKKKDAEFKKGVADALKAAGYPAKADPAKVDKFMIVVILTYLVILVTMVYGPIAAMLVELFPTRIRYTSMSLPYHIGNGWFGGLLPTTAFAIVAQTGNMYNGLWYPIIIAAMTFVIGMVFVKETKDVDTYARD